MRFLRCRRALWVVCSALVMAGCGSGGGTLQTASVKGTVTWNGAPLEEGVVLFVHETGGQGGVRTTIPARIEGGAYALDAPVGPVVGSNRIEVRAKRKIGERRVPVFEESGRMTSQTTTVDVTKQFIPKEFNDQSTLVRQVGRGENQFDFVLNGKERTADDDVQR